MSRHVIMFQPRFASLVSSGTKLQTIRPPRKRPIKAGDVLDLRRWSGKPYRSRQDLLVEAVCVRSAEVYIDPCGVVLDGHAVSIARAFAVADGFHDWEDMRDWFASTHGLPFRGVCIWWSLDPALALAGGVR